MEADRLLSELPEHLVPMVVQVNTNSWRMALKRAGIENFRWHDLRHTWASWHVQSGTPLHVLQELGAWESSDMVRRYAHFSSGYLAMYVDRLRDAQPRLRFGYGEQNELQVISVTH